MPTRYHGRFFDQSTTQSQAKLRIYRAYLKPWASKLGSNRSNRRLWVIDGFAGRGRYRDGSPGSPELAMQLAKDVATDVRSYQIRCIFGETRRDNQRVLTELAGRYPESSAMVIEDDFWDRIHDVTALVAGEPALLFIDPFGLAGLRFDRLAELVNGLGKVDLIVNLRTPVAPRLAPKLSNRISAAVGSDDWETGTVSAVFRRNLSTACRFLPAAPLQIRDRLGGRLHTELVLASRAPDAYELWNDEIVKEVERLDAASEAGESVKTRDLNIESVADRLAEWSRGQARWRRQDAINWHVVEYCGDAHTGTIKRAHKLLLESGRIRALDPQAKVDDNWFVSA